jgi:hypothetical protein
LLLLLLDWPGWYGQLVLLQLVGRWLLGCVWRWVLLQLLGCLLHVRFLVRLLLLLVVLLLLLLLLLVVLLMPMRAEICSLLIATAASCVSWCCQVLLLLVLLLLLGRRSAAAGGHCHCWCVLYVLHNV